MTTLDGRRERSSVQTSDPQDRIIGLTGIVGTVVLFAALIVGSPGEPRTDATTAEAAKYLAGLPGWVAQVDVVVDIAMMVVLWSMVGLALVLRRFEGATPVRSTMAMLSAVLVAGWVILDVGQEAGAHRAADLDQGQLAYAYDLTAIGLMNILLPFGTFAFACGWVIVSSKAMPRWLGWWGVISGIGLSLMQFIWKTEAWYALYIPVWLWLVTTWVVLVRQPLEPAPADTSEGTDR
jgi:hypothetical protein